MTGVQTCALPILIEFYKNKKISLEKIVEKTAHNPAILFRIEKRGFIREGYYADLEIGRASCRERV